jgi:hypothetical protein
MQWFEPEIKIPHDRVIYDAYVGCLYHVFGEGLRVLPLGAPTHLPVKFGGLGVPHINGIPFSFKKKTGARWKNTLRKLAHCDGVFGIMLRTLPSGVAWNPLYPTVSSVMKLIAWIYTSKNGRHLPRWVSYSRDPNLYSIDAVVHLLSMGHGEILYKWVETSDGTFDARVSVNDVLDLANERYNVVSIRDFVGRLTSALSSLSQSMEVAAGLAPMGADPIRPTHHNWLRNLSLIEKMVKNMEIVPGTWSYLKNKWDQDGLTFIDLDSWLPLLEELGVDAYAVF